MKINVKKIKVMCISCTGNCKVNLLMNSKLVEQVKQLKYLQNWIPIDGYCKTEFIDRQT